MIFHSTFHNKIRHKKRKRWHSDFVFQEELRICVLPTHLSYDAPWPVRKVPLRCTPHFVTYHLESKTYCVITSTAEPLKSYYRFNGEDKVLKIFYLFQFSRISVNIYLSNSLEAILKINFGKCVFCPLGIYGRGACRKISLSVSRTIFHCTIFSSFMGNYSQYKNRAGSMGTRYLLKECVSGLRGNEVWFERLHSIRNKL